MSVEMAGSVDRGAFTLAAELVVEPGSVVAVLGPNGSGKTTLLRAVAGLQPLSSGYLRINGRTMDDSSSVFVRPRERSVGVVFQDYALFPHLTVRENVAFGPRSRGLRAGPARELADEALSRLGVGALSDRRPADISGGQAQRVALARALATDPDVLILDEPTSALDVDTRDAVRAELDEQLAAFEGCTLLVTHDPLDALLLADRVVVLEDGRIVQDGSPAELARQPATSYVASLMGVTLLRGSVTDGLLAVDGGGTLHVAVQAITGRALCVVRPEAVTVHRSRPEGSARNVWQGTVAALQPSHDRVRVIIEGHPGVTAVVTPAAVAEMGLGKGTPVWVSMKAVDLSVYPSPAH
jgi:molybdate transport system ATP-binding protein